MTTYAANGKRYMLSEVERGRNLCGDCAFRDDPGACRAAPDCVEWSESENKPVNYCWKETK